MNKTFRLLALWFGFLAIQVPVLAADLIQVRGTTSQVNPISHHVRALHLSLEPAAKADEQVTPEKAKRLITLAKNNGFNTLIILLANNVVLKSMPGSMHDRSWTSREFIQVVEFARSNGLDVIPEVKLLNKQRMFFANNYPNLMFNTNIYDPRKDEVYRIVFSALDEIIDLIHPKAIHIGHDEILGEGPLPAQLFLQDVERIHAHLNKRGVETWMWGDMLIASQEFPGMFNEDKSLNGGALGYGKDLRDQLPKDIVICDWHYVWGRPNEVQFPSLATFKAEGFRVLGATFTSTSGMQNFSRYASEHGAEGMVATLWQFPRQNKWDVVERIIRESGEAFRKDFPDAK
jgi:hypothetical protein